MKYYVLFSSWFFHDRKGFDFFALFFDIIIRNLMTFQQSEEIFFVIKCVCVLILFLTATKMCYASQVSGNQHVLIDMYDTYNSPYTSCQCDVNVTATSDVELSIRTLAGITGLHQHCKANVKLTSTIGTTTSGCTVSGQLQALRNDVVTMQLLREATSSDSRFCIHLQSSKLKQDIQLL